MMAGLYVHYLPTTRPDVIRRYWDRYGVPAQDFVSLVLNVGIQGVRKTCGIVCKSA